MFTMNSMKPAGMKRSDGNIRNRLQSCLSPNPNCPCMDARPVSDREPDAIYGLCICINCSLFLRSNNVSSLANSGAAAKRSNVKLISYSALHNTAIHLNVRRLTETFGECVGAAVGLQRTAAAIMQPAAATQHQDSNPQILHSGVDGSKCLYPTLSR